MTPTRQFTDDEIRDLLPEAELSIGPDGLQFRIGDIETAVSSELGRALLATRLELKQARERLAVHEPDCCPECGTVIVGAYGVHHSAFCGQIDRNFDRFPLIPAPPETQAPSLAGKGRFSQWLTRAVDTLARNQDDERTVFLLDFDREFPNGPPALPSSLAWELHTFLRWYVAETASHIHGANLYATSATKEFYAAMVDKYLSESGAKP